jgi:hypothetical protein
MRRRSEWDSIASVLLCGEGVLDEGLHVLEVGDGGVGEDRKRDGTALIGELRGGDDIADNRRSGFEAIEPADAPRVADDERFFAEAGGEEHGAGGLEETGPS